MNKITKQTRLDSYLSNNHETRYKEILSIMDNRKMTAREITNALGYTDLNAVSPRLTELEQRGIVEIVGKVKDEISERTVALYKVVID